MAAEAVLKIKEAEEQAKELTRSSNEKAKQMIVAAGKEGQEKKKAILAQAREQRKKMLAAAADRAEESCKELAAKGEEDRKKILEPGEAGLMRAVNLVVERIVNV